MIKAKNYASYNEKCDNGTLECDPSKSLFCSNGLCACSDSNLYWSASSKICGLFFNEII